LCIRVSRVVILLPVNVTQEVSCLLGHLIRVIYDSWTVETCSWQYPLALSHKFLNNFSHKITSVKSSTLFPNVPTAGLTHHARWPCRMIKDIKLIIQWQYCYYLYSWKQLTTVKLTWVSHIKAKSFTIQACQRIKLIKIHKELNRSFIHKNVPWYILWFVCGYLDSFPKSKFKGWRMKAVYFRTYQVNNRVIIGTLVQPVPVSRLLPESNLSPACRSHERSWHLLPLNKS
jgi:hypothetical protein